jgi:hypothetical protein
VRLLVLRRFLRFSRGVLLLNAFDFVSQPSTTSYIRHSQHAKEEGSQGAGPREAEGEGSKCL